MDKIQGKSLLDSYLLYNKQNKCDLNENIAERELCIIEDINNNFQFFGENFIKLRTNTLLKLFKSNEEIKKIEKSEHELTRNFISDKMEFLLSEVAKKDDLLKSKEEIINTIKAESEQVQSQLEYKIKDLKGILERHLPHRRTFRFSIYMVSLLLFCSFSNFLWGIVIIKPFWLALGFIISIGFLIMSYFLFIDWRNSVNATRNNN